MTDNTETLYWTRADGEAAHVVDDPVPSWRELFGSIPEITNGLSVNEYLEAVRGED